MTVYKGENIPPTRPENRAGELQFGGPTHLGHFTECSHVHSEGVDVPVRRWKMASCTEGKSMERLRNALSRVWSTIRILSTLKTIWDFMRDHFDFDF